MEIMSGEEGQRGGGGCTMEECKECAQTHRLRRADGPLLNGMDERELVIVGLGEHYSFSLLISMFGQTSYSSYSFL